MEEVAAAVEGRAAAAAGLAAAGWVAPREDEAEARGAERAKLGRFPLSRQDKMAAAEAEAAAAAAGEAATAARG